MNLICVSIYIIVGMNKKIILINKFNEKQPRKYPSCDIKYINLYVFFEFLLLFMTFIYLLTQMIFYLFYYMYA